MPIFLALLIAGSENVKKTSEAVRPKYHGKLRYSTSPGALTLGIPRVFPITWCSIMLILVSNWPI